MDDGVSGTSVRPAWLAREHHATFIVHAAVTSRRRKPAKRADPVTAPGWLAVLLLVALACVIGAVVL